MKSRTPPCARDQDVRQANMLLPLAHKNNKRSKKLQDQVRSSIQWKEASQPKSPPPKLSQLRLSVSARTFHCRMEDELPLHSTSHIAQFSIVGAPFPCPMMVLCSEDRNPPCVTTTTVRPAQCSGWAAEPLRKRLERYLHPQSLSV